MPKLPLYILHGWAIDQHNQAKWQPFIDELAEAQQPATFLPLPGLSAPLEEIWGLDDYVRWTVAQLPQEPVALLGHSFGGQIAIRLAAQHPERVAKLVLVDSAGMRDRALGPTLKRKIFLVAAKVGKVFFRATWARTVLYKLARERDYNAAPPLLKRAMSSILDDEIVHELPLVKCPTLIIWGENDKVTPLKLGRFYHQQIAGSQLVVLPDARHSPQFTHTAAVATEVSKFL